jgi:hypothetical protein
MTGCRLFYHFRHFMAAHLQQMEKRPQGIHIAGAYYFPVAKITEKGESVFNTVSCT